MKHHLSINKIAIAGRPGSGKSTFALKLGEYLKLPVHHLDKIFFTDNWVSRHKEDFLNLKQQWMSTHKWIIDGNSLSSLYLRYEQADIMIIFLLPRWKCFFRIFKRRFMPRNIKIDDRATNCPERISWKLLMYTWTFNRRIEPILSELKEKYSNKPLYIIRTDQEAESLLDHLSL